MIGDKRYWYSERQVEVVQLNSIVDLSRAAVG